MKGPDLLGLTAELGGPNQGFCCVVWPAMNVHGAHIIPMNDPCHRPGIGRMINGALR